VKEKKISLKSLGNAEFESYLRRLNADLLRVRLERPRDAKVRVGLAKYTRARIVAAVKEALAALKPYAIQMAWNTSHLYPFYGTPNYSKEKEQALLQQIPKADRDFLLSRRKEAEPQIPKVSEGQKKVENAPVPMQVEDAQASVNAEEPSGAKRVAVVRRGRKGAVAVKRGRKTTESAEADDVPETKVAEKRRRIDSSTEIAEDKENQNEANSAGGRKGRKGPQLYKGLLTCADGLAWLKKFESNEKNYSVTTSTVTLTSPAGPIVVKDRSAEAEREVADPDDYFTALESDAEKYFNAFNPCCFV